MKIYFHGSPKSFIVLALGFGSVIILELIFVRCMKQEFSFIPIHVDIHLFQHKFLKTVLSPNPLEWLAPLLVGPKYTSLFLDSQFCPTDQYISYVSITLS